MQRFKRISFPILIVLFCSNLWAQKYSDSFYKNIPVQEFRSKYKGDVQFDTNGHITYTINGQKVSRREYNKVFDQPTCCPCLHKWYNEQDQLIYESVLCGECHIGSYREYYPEGSLKVKGQYLETDKKNFSNLYRDGLCSVKAGVWQYFDHNGQLQYTETWDKGQFIKQQPEQDSLEIWKTDLLVNNLPFTGGRLLNSEDIKTIKLANYFKNSKQTPVKLTLKLSISVGSYSRQYLDTTIDADSIRFFDLDDYLTSKRIFGDTIAIGGIIVYANNRPIWVTDLGYRINLPPVPEWLKTQYYPYSNFKKNNIYLINSFNPRRKILISPKSIYNPVIYVNDIVKDSSIEYLYHKYEGDLIKLDSVTLKMNVKGETTSIEYVNGRSNYSNKNYWAYWDDNDTGYHVNLQLNQLSSITYTSRLRSTMQNLTGGMIFCSALTTLIVAPLVSINYNTGQFNNKLYFKVAGAGLAGLGISIPLGFLSSDRSYKLTTPNGIKSKKYWYLQQ